MADLEKVIRGLRCCRNIHIGATLDDSCNQCPYQKEKGRTCVADELFHDAIALLKAQEPRVMHLEDAQGTDYVWYESRKAGCVFPASVCMSSDTWHGELTTDVQQIGYGGYKFVLDKEYNRAWRCWNHRPTYAQREAVKWDD